MSEWETFCDTSYYDLWRVRRKTDRGFDDGFHLTWGPEAKGLVDLLNGFERIREAALAVVQRWDQPSWKDAEPTAAVINKLRNALEMEEE